MSFFTKLKNKFTKKTDDEVTTKYEKGLEKTRNEFVSKLSLLGIKYTKVSDEYFDELEKILISADIGINTVFKFMDRIKERVRKENIIDTKYLNEVIVDELFIIYVEGENLTDKINYSENGPTVILMIGVNGVGKTTTIGKIANKLRLEGKKVIVAAADTFRAAAVEQLEIWANRANVDIVKKEEGADPASVVYDAIKKAKETNADVLICDTAGRLHNKKNLMDELKKIDRIIEKEYPDAYRENLIVLDGTTGQNALSQLKEFREVADISGIILTKMDGTAKGGIAVAIQSEYGVPVKYIGVGEHIDDLQKFDSDEFVNALFDIKGDTEND